MQPVYTKFRLSTSNPFAYLSIPLSIQVPVWSKADRFRKICVNDFQIKIEIDDAETSGEELFHGIPTLCCILGFTASGSRKKPQIIKENGGFSIILYPRK